MFGKTAHFLYILDCKRKESGRRRNGHAYQKNETWLGRRSRRRPIIRFTRSHNPPHLLLPSHHRCGPDEYSLQALDSPQVLDLNTTLHFSESAQFQKEKFRNLVSHFLKIQNLDRLQRFKLKMHFYGVDNDHLTLMRSYYGYGNEYMYDQKSQIDGWLKTTMDHSKGLKEMNICIKSDRDTKYRFKSNNVLHSNSLAVLKLGCVKLECVRLATVSHVELPSLKSLSLKKVYLDYMTLKNLLIGCPSIEDLVLDSCHGLGKVVVPCSSLKSFIIRYPRYVIHNVDEKRSIQVEALNLDTFVYDGGFVCKANIDVGGCGRVRSVRVLKAGLDHDQWLDNLLNLQVESLTLDHCAGFKQINIRSPHVKVLYLGGYGFYSYRCKGAVQATNIDTPNLVSFSCEFQGKIIPNFSVNAPTMLEPCIKLISKEAYTTDWYVNLIYFLKNFDGFKSLSLKANKEVCIKFSQSISIMVFASFAILIVFIFLTLWSCMCRRLYQSQRH